MYPTLYTPFQLSLPHLTAAEMLEAEETSRMPIGDGAFKVEFGG